MWLLIDNYDSYTYILLHYLLELENNVQVVKNDELKLEDVEALKPACIIISPGPKRPKQAGIVMTLIAHYAGKLPVLGICLGHQALGTYMGADLVHAAYPMHGKIDNLLWNTDKAVPSVFRNLVLLPEQAMRYHSLLLKNYEDVPDFVPLAWAQSDNALMAFISVQNKFMGIQFHPESIGTPLGKKLLSLWKLWANL